MCPKCGATLKWYDLIPLLSFINLRGKCRACKELIGWQYPFIELITAILWIGLYSYIQPESAYSIMQFGAWIGVGSLMIATFVYDARWMLLPEIFTLPALGIAIMWLIIRWLGFDEGAQVLQQVMVGSLFAVIFWALSYFSGGKLLGDGDSRIALLMGLLLSPAQLIIAATVSFNLGAIVGLILIGLGKKSRRDPIAFGPYLISGLFIGFFIGDWMITHYLALLSI